MDLQLAFADSEVSRVEATADGLRILFSAASAWRRRDGAARTIRGPQAGHARSVELRLAGATLPASAAEAIGRLSEGRVALDGRWRTTLALPSQHAGPCRLELAFANRSVLEVSGGALSCRFLGDPNFAESLAC